MQDSLHHLLHPWEVRPAANPNFRTDVWRRIEARKHRLSFRLRTRAESIFAQPVWATAMLVVMLVAGSVTGNAWRRHEMQEERTAGFMSYVLAVNPAAHEAALH
jgi:hypothetical protein